MKSYEMELNGETIRLRLRSIDICEIEEKNGNKSIVDIIRDVSQRTVIMFLMYMRRFEIPNYSKKDASELYDKFIDNDYSMQDVLFNVIYEGLVVSGVMTKGELENLKTVIGVTQEKLEKKVQKITQE